jgi:hypothetical protein
MTGGRRPGPLGEDHCAYRKPKLERNGDEGRRGSRVIERFQSAEPGE